MGTVIQFPKVLKGSYAEDRASRLLAYAMVEEAAQLLSTLDDADQELSQVLRDGVAFYLDDGRSSLRKTRLFQNSQLTSKPSPQPVSQPIQSLQRFSKKQFPKK